MSTQIGVAPRRIYVASKAKHAQVWLDLREALTDIDIISTWIDEAGEGESDSLTHLWDRCICEAHNADALIALYITGEEWKGAFVEIGAALASDTPIYVVGDPPGSWVYHEMVTRVATIADALVLVRQP